MVIELRYRGWREGGKERREGVQQAQETIREERIHRQDIPAPVKCLGWRRNALRDPGGRVSIEGGIVDVVESEIFLRAPAHHRFAIPNEEGNSKQRAGGTEREIPGRESQLKQPIRPFQPAPPVLLEIPKLLVR